jgi:cyanophycinase
MVVARAVPVTLALLAGAPEAVAQYDDRAAEPIPRLAGGVVAWSGGELPGRIREAVFAMLPERERPKLALVLAGYGGEVEALAPWAEVGFHDFEVHSPDAPDPLFSSELASTLEGADALWIGDMDSALMQEAWESDAVVRRVRSVVERGGVMCAEGRSAALLGLPVAGDARSLGVLPGAVVLTGYEADRDEVRVSALLAGDPENVVLAVEPETALVLDERFFRARGAGAVRAFVAESRERPRREDVIDGDERGDLVALWRSAHARHSRAFPSKQPGKPLVERGSLVLVGGGGLPPGLLERFVELAGGPDAPIVYVPCEYARELSGEPGFVQRLRDAGAKDVTWIHTKDRAVADGDAALLDPLRRARGIWFGGGRQWNFVDSYQHTEAHRLMEQVLARGGAIGGSSAGASIQADYMARGNPLGNRDIMAEGYEEGLGFLTGVAVDQHFTQRGRGHDLASLVLRHPQYLGIGLDESTALVVHESTAEVVGAHADRHVYFYDGRRADEDADGTLWDAVAPGGRYDLAKRAVLE